MFKAQFTRLVAATCVIGMVGNVASAQEVEDEARIAIQAVRQAEALQRAQIRQILANPQQRVPMLPARAAFRGVEMGNSRSPYDLSSLAQAKFDVDEEKGNQIIFLIERYRPEIRTRTVNVRRIEMEEQVVTQVIDGEEKQITRKVPKQVMEQREQEYTIQVPAGKKPVAVAFDKVRLFHIDGTEVAKEQAESLLTSLKPVFVWHRAPENATVPAASDLIRRVLNPDTLVAVTKELQQVPQP